MFFLAIDAHSKWPEVSIMSFVTTGRTIRALRELYARFGIPHQLVSDNGLQFVSEVLKQFMLINGIKHNYQEFTLSPCFKWGSEENGASFEVGTKG